MSATSMMALLGILSRMNNEQLQFALELERGELFDVGGNRVTWTVGGTVMPVTFSLQWLEKWEAKLSVESDELPSQHDWDKEQRRELCRDYYAAINNTLVKLGYAQQFGSRYTWRWLYTNRQARWNGLKYIGLDLALAISRGILDIENGDENE